MRKSILSAVLILSASALWFNACKKQESPNKPGLNSFTNEIITKVNAWLEEQKSNDNLEKNGKIQSLKDNLNFSEIQYEQFKQAEKFIVIPIKKEFITVNNKGKDPINFFLVTINDSGRITRGNIVQFIPQDRNIDNTVSPRTFINIFNGNSVESNGEFAFLNISDEFQFALRYKNGKLFSYSFIKKTSAPHDSNGKIDGCTYVYLVTHYSDGSEDWEFWYSYCDHTNECNQTRLVKGGNLRIACEGGGGGSGNDYDCLNSELSEFEQAINESQIASQLESTNVSYINDFTKHKDPKWIILNGVGWQLHSQEIGVIKLIDAQNNTWAWKSLNHGSITMTGSPPPIMDVSFTQGVGTPSFTPEAAEMANIFYAGIELKFSVTYRFVCHCPNIPVVGWVPPISTSYTSTALWDANPF